MRLDAVIFGGGVAGLWVLDRLTRQGCQALLLEARALGFGQTISAQGIIHGGLKYSLQGWMTKSAQHIRRMPDLWQKSLQGEGFPDLRKTRLRSPACYLWHTDSFTSLAGMIGARFGLQVTPEAVAENERPTALSRIRGSVARLPEQVIDPASFLADLEWQYRERILLIDSDEGVRFDLSSPGEVSGIRLKCPETGRKLLLEPAHVVFTAGSGNARLRKRVGLDGDVMQRRPLHMVIARGALPELNGHCIDGLKTRATITSDQDSQGRTVWQVGGQIAEDGVRMTPLQLTQHACDELRAILPGLDLSGVEWSTYHIDRAEAATDNGSRPETIQVLCAGNVTTAWPTKLALSPVLAEEIAARVLPAAGKKTPGLIDAVADWPRPTVAEYPWNESERSWWSVDLAAPPVRVSQERRAA